MAVRSTKKKTEAPPSTEPRMLVCLQSMTRGHGDVVAEGDRIPEDEVLARGWPVDSFAPADWSTPAIRQAKAKLLAQALAAVPEDAPTARITERLADEDAVVCVRSLTVPAVDGLSLSGMSGAMIIGVGDRMRRNDPVVAAYPDYFRPAVDERTASRRHAAAGTAWRRKAQNAARARRVSPDARRALAAPSLDSCCRLSRLRAHAIRPFAGLSAGERARPLVSRRCAPGQGSRS